MITPDRVYVGTEHTINKINDPSLQAIKLTRVYDAVTLPVYSDYWKWFYRVFFFKFKN